MRPAELLSSFTVSGSSPDLAEWSGVTGATPNTNNNNGALLDSVSRAFEPKKKIGKERVKK